MTMKLCVCLIIFSIGPCCGIIYHLNESEYERLPRLFELDNYEQCMEDAGGIYCVANAELYPHNTSDLYTLIQEYSEYTLKHYNYSKIDRGVCVTQKCQSYATNAGLDINRDLIAVLEGCLNETMLNKYDLMARVYNANCEKSEDKDELNLDYFDYVFLSVFIILLVLAVAGSFCDLYSKDSGDNLKKGASVKDFLLCFSVPENYKKLTSIEQKDPRLDIFKCLHGFRVIVTFSVVYAHTVLMVGSGFTADPHSFEKAYESVLLRITFSGLNVVQFFFFITGMLLAYLSKVGEETKTLSWKTIPKIIFYRWWRLTPSAALMVAFSATWMRHLGRGPLWKTYVANGTSSQCRHFFWAHIFYFNNYISEDKLCALQTWYIAADMQVFIVGIIIHFAIRNLSGKFKVITLTSLLLLSMAGPALQVWWQDIDAFAMQKPEVYRTINDAHLRNLHVLGHYNLSASIIGLASGYLMYFLQKNNVEYPNFKIGNLLSWFTIPMYLFLLYCGSLFYYDGERTSLALRALYAGTNRAIVGLIGAFVMIAVTLKFNGFTKALIESSNWVVPSRLTYCVYLLHLLIIEFGLGTRSQLTPVSNFSTFFMSIGVFVVTFAVAVPFHLLIEAPTSRITKLSTNEIPYKKLD